MKAKLSILFTFLVLYGCVGARKYKQLSEEKLMLEKQHQDYIQNSEEETNTLQTSEAHLRDELIRQNTLLSSLLADKLNLEKEISTLQNTINQVSDESESTQALLNQELQKKNASLQRKEEILNQLVAYHVEQQEILINISGALSEKLVSFSSDEIEWILVDRQLNILIYGHLLFNVRNQISQKAKPALDEISLLVKEHPSLLVIIEGHTDNAPEKEDQALENTALQATQVAKYLLDPGGINSNQIQVASRGGYSPRVSNQTPAGRQMNNRVEIQIHASAKEIFEIIRDQTN